MVTPLLLLQCPLHAQILVLLLVGLLLPVLPNQLMMKILLLNLTKLTPLLNKLLMTV
jgi:hypothetical protein